MPNRKISIWEIMAEEQYVPVLRASVLADLVGNNHIVVYRGCEAGGGICWRIVVPVEILHQADGSAGRTGVVRLLASVLAVAELARGREDGTPRYSEQHLEGYGFQVWHHTDQPKGIRGCACYDTDWHGLSDGIEEAKQAIRRIAEVKN